MSWHKQTWYSGQFCPCGAEWIYTYVAKNKEEHILHHISCEKGHTPVDWLKKSDLNENSLL